MPIRKSPAPFFDTLEEMPNPYKSPVRDVSHLLRESPEDAVADYQYASEFIYSYRGSPDTFSTYRREIEHFLHWCWLVRQKSLNAILREDFEAYVDFARIPPASWIGKRNVARFVLKDGLRTPNPRWRPYVSAGNEYVLSQAALQSLFSVLSSFFNFLIQENYAAANPVAKMRQKSKFLRGRQGQSRIRRLSPLQWEYVIEAAEKMAAEKPATHERTLFIMNALFALYLRISELVETPRWQPQMGHFQLDQEGNWWFLTVGKGNKEREISVSDAMLEALKRYRRSRGLPSLPAPGEASPLIHRNRGGGGVTSTRQIRRIVQECFDRAAAGMRSEGFEEDADRLAEATVHWLRHTGISEDVKHRPREHVRDDAGHGSSAITDRYIDVERTERHATARHKRIQN
ncbi:MAG: tyrosine-type recombinase/integrase [Gammaproteobacteria bacterium]|nr:tyrosine-type recombinase/integrase [Gammaproteobacteria bacterium]MYG96539.1 tyrosine-type recombinase/integrase [Gammaproteobacteria bacterium]